MRVTADKQANIKNAESFIESAAAQGANLVVLPEMWNCPYSNSSFPTYAECIDDGSSESSAALSTAAAKHQLTVIGGSIPERSEGKLYNTCCVFDATGNRIARHRKAHLFDIDIPGKIRFRESDTLTGGDSLTCVSTAVGKVGIGICYDIRFPEMAMVYRSRGASLLVYPGAFNMTTGPIHWQLLQQARAVDNQLFVCSCSPARDLDAEYHAWGHSMVVGPFGEVLDELQDGEGMLVQTLDMQEVDTRRQNMPLDKQRRRDLYRLEDGGA